MTRRSKLLGAVTAMMLGVVLASYSTSAVAYPYAWHYHHHGYYHPAYGWHHYHWHPYPYYAWHHPYWHYHYYTVGYPYYAVGYARYYYGPPPLLGALAAIALAPAALLSPGYYHYGP